MTLISRTRLVFIVLALCAVLTIAPLASAQTEPLPMPGIGEDFSPLGLNQHSVNRNFGFEVIVEPLNPVGDVMDSITVTEFGAPVAVTFRLSAAPQNPVTLTQDWFPLVYFLPQEITFTPENWDVPQTVMVYAGGDYETQNEPWTLKLGGYPSYPLHMVKGIVNGQLEGDTADYNNFDIVIVDTPVVVPSEPLVVTTLDDALGQNIDGSLRQAILIANAREGEDVITFAPELTGTITLAAALPGIMESLTIRGPGQDRLSIDGSNTYPGFNSRMYSNESSRLRLYDVTLTQMTMVIYAYRLVLQDVTIQDSGMQDTMSRTPLVVLASEALTVRRSIFRNNVSVASGALYVETDATIEDSTFIDNRALAQDGFTRIIAGALNVDMQGVSRLEIYRSTFANNTGQQVGAIGVYRGSILIFNSTFSANAAVQPGGTAAIYSTDLLSGIYFSTFSGHNTGTGSGGVIKGLGMEASVIANNSAANPVECVGAVSGVLNFSADPNCNGAYPKGVPTGVDPVLRNNGGLTMTHALLPGSNVIDSDQPIPEENNFIYCNGPMGSVYAATDQRGVPRPQFGACDFGAFETNWVTLPPVNRSVNGSFEAAGATFNDANGWTGRNLNPDDYRRCDSALTPVAVQNGACAFMFRGPNANNEPRRLTQTLEGGGWSRAGKVLRLSAQVRTKNLGAGGRLAINVVYRDGTTGTALVRIPAGTNPYQRVMVRLPLAKRADSVTITVRLKTGGNQNTRLWVDNVILVSQ